MAYIRENKEKMQQLLQKIGQCAYSAAPEDWFKLVVGYFLAGEDKNAHQQFLIGSLEEDDYIDIMEASWNCDDYDDVIPDLADLCGELHELCAKAGDDWQSMTFVLEANGSFNADYSYDPIDTYDSRFILNWQAKYLD